MDSYGALQEIVKDLANENLTIVQHKEVYMLQYNGTYYDMMNNIVAKKLDLLALVEHKDLFDFTNGNHDSSWYWKKRGTYRKTDTVNEELSGAKFELPTCGVFTKTIQEAQAIAKGLKKVLVYVKGGNG